MNSIDKVKKAVAVLDNKKADEIKVIRVDDLTILADYFVIASTGSSTHVKSLSDEVEYQLKESGIVPKSMEGYQHANWIIMDYHDVVVHIFQEETREFYSLERLWADGKQIPLESLISE